MTSQFQILCLLTDKNSGQSGAICANCNVSIQERELNSRPSDAEGVWAVISLGASMSTWSPHQLRGLDFIAACRGSDHSARTLRPRALTQNS